MNWGNHVTVQGSHEEKEFLPSMMRTDIPWGGVIGNNMLSRLFLFFSLFFVSLVGSLAIAIIFFSGHASGVLVRRFGCRVTTLFGGFLCTLNLGLSSLARNINVLFLTYSVLYG